MQLRDYQTRSIKMLYEWFEKNNDGHVAINLPTGSGKSHIIAEICKDALTQWPETRILVMSHVKELLEQDAEKIRIHWPGAPMGIYSAGIGLRQIGEPITVAGIQSVRNKANGIGHIDLCIIDECHLVSHKEQGGYRTLLSALSAINPSLRVIGLTATNYRLGHGLITDKPALFDALIEPVTIEELIFKKYLSPLRSKHTVTQFDVSEVKKRGGEYIEGDLQKAVNKKDKNAQVVSEIIEKAGDRKAWLIFCAGVDHAYAIRDSLVAAGIPTDCLTGETPKTQRDQMLADFKAGKLQALTNVNVLSTGFDYPDIDLIAMLRPTMSPGLYVQMAGRGMRPKSHTDHCLVLDFAGNVEMHGPITAVTPPAKKGEKKGEAPVKLCEHCQEIVAISCKVCPACGEPFPPPQAKVLQLHNDDIMGLEGKDMPVTSWQWRKHTSRASGNEMLAVTYYGSLSDAPITEYFPVLNPGYAGQKAIMTMAGIAGSAGVSQSQMQGELDRIPLSLNAGIPPSVIEYRRDGKFFRVLKRSWQ